MGAGAEGGLAAQPVLDLLPQEARREVPHDRAGRRLESRGHYGLWPQGIGGTGVTANVKALSECRNRAIHLYNARGLGAVIHPFLQQNVLNYRDFMRRFVTAADNPVL